jgi:diacylglycerol kinase (CTP)
MFQPLTEWRELKNRSDLHLARKVWHLTSVFSVFLFFQLASTSVSAFALFILGPIAIALDFLRLRSEKVNDVVVAVLGPIMRNQEVKSLAGTTYLISGVALIFLIFPKPVVALSILFLAFADPIASYVGIRYGRERIVGNKTLQGFLAALLVCFILTLVYIYQPGISMSRAIVVSILGGIIGALAELAPMGKLDDNFTMPVLSACGLYILFQMFDMTAQLS